MSSTLGIAMIGHLLWAMFGVHLLIPLHHWVHGVVVSFGVDQGVNFPCAVVAIFTVAGFRAALAPSLWFLPKGIIHHCIPFVVVVLLGCIHHVYII